MSERGWSAAIVARCVTILVIAASVAGTLRAQQYAAADITSGARVYAALCSPCHGPTGTGVGGIDLRRGPLPRASTDGALSALLASGIPGTGMPAFHLDANDLKSIVAFLRAGFEDGTTAPAGNPEHGRTIFEGKGNCLGCHLASGRGRDLAPDLTDIGRARSAAGIQRSLIDPTGSMLPINRPVRAETRDGTIITGRRLNEDTYTVQIVTDEGRLLSLVKSELRGWTIATRSPMPSYKDTLTPEEMIDLVAYVASFKGTR